jgi:hypothetical protein
MLAAGQNLKRFILPDCPPTVHIQGIHDRSVPLNATYAFYTILFEAGVSGNYRGFSVNIS